MNSTELAVLRQRCDRGETFTAEEMEYVLGTLAPLLSVEDDCGIGCEFCGYDCDADWDDEDEADVA